VTRWLALLGTGVLTFLVIDSSVSRSLLLYYGLYTLIALCVVAILAHLLVSPQGRMARLLSWKPLVQLGAVSYGIYLWHNPVFHLVSTGSVGWLNWPVQLIRLVATAVLVALSYRYIEKPALHLKERFSGSAPVVPPLPAAPYVAHS
jgi:peptidoglycan/LPS O-acetylase OafA/YrhL